MMVTRLLMLVPGLASRTENVVKFELKLTNQMEKKTTKTKYKWSGRRNKNNVKFGKYK